MLRIEAHANGVYRLRCGLPKKLDDNQLNPRAQQRADLLLARTEISGEFECEPVEDGWHLKQSNAGNTSLLIHANPFRLTFYQDERMVFQTAQDFDASLVTQLDAEEQSNAWSIVWQLTPDEAVYGLGRTDGGFNRRGQMLVSDLSQFAYMPLAWSLQGWGLYANSLQRVSHYIASEDPDSYRLQIEDSCLDVFIFLGDPSEIANQYSALRGRAGQPPLKAMGVWLQQQEGQSIEALAELNAQLIQAGYPVDTWSFASPSLVPFQHDKLSLDLDEQR